MTAAVSAARRREVIAALRRGTVPQAGLDLFAVGLERFHPAMGDDLATVTKGGAAFHAIRGEYGSGKTFFARWLAERAKRPGSPPPRSRSPRPRRRCTGWRRFTGDSPSG